MSRPAPGPSARPIVCPTARKVTLRLTAALLAPMLLTACARLENVGQAPAFAAPGEAVRPAPGLAPARVALATPPPSTGPAPGTTASLWRSGPESLFGDRRARRHGDIVTVVIEIDDNAEMRNNSERRRSASEDLSVSALFGLPSLISRALDINTDPAVGIGSNSSSSGEGSVRRNEKIALRIAVTVVDVLPNGHLVVAGNQEVRVNYELRDLQVVGVVRPEDISRRNEITYDKMAEARISYGGRGQITDVQQPRYGQQVLDVIVPF